MEPLNAIAILITLSASFAYINYRVIRMPMSIGLMLMSLLISILLIILDGFGLPVRSYADRLVAGIDFNKVLMEGMLGMLLFAGALHVNINDLSNQKLEIGIFASVGVLASTFLVGCAVYGLSQWFDFPLRFIECLLFGALISPTDPIAVLGIMKKAGAPKSLETKIAGESLFNDGIGVVVFLVLLDIAVGGGTADAGNIAMMFTTEAIGGAVFGGFVGFITYLMLKSVDNYQVEVMLTLALVIGGYVLASKLHLSAAIAMVVAGLLIGNKGRMLAMSDTTRNHLDLFWELVDEILNALLFVLIGLEVLVLTLRQDHLLMGILAIPVALISRFISVGGPVLVLKKFRPFVPKAVRIMTWGGLRGGISVALALALPETCNREFILTMTYVVVVFSILVQGLTIQRLMATK